MRHELLAMEQFDGLLEAQVLVADWRSDYDTVRPHSALGMLTQAEYADRWVKNNPKTLITPGPRTGSGHATLVTCRERP